MNSTSATDISVFAGAWAFASGTFAWWEPLMWILLCCLILFLALIHLSPLWSQKTRQFLFGTEMLTPAHAVSLSNDFIWILQLDAYGLLTRAFTGGNIAGITGRNPAYFNNFFQAFESIVHAQDLVDRRLLFNDLATGAVVQFECNYRIMLPDGDIQWLHDRIRSKRTKKGGLLIEGVTTQITDQKEKEEALKKSSGFLSAIINAMTQPMFVKDQERKLVMVNRAFCAMMQKTEAELIGKTDEDLFPEDLAGEFRRSDLQVLTHVADIYEKETTEVYNNRVFYVVKTRYYSQSEDTSYIIGIITDLTDRKRQEEELRRAVAKAEEALKGKSMFLASMSHEIRTPMNSILGMAELLAETDLNDEQAEFVSIVNQAGVTLLTLINDILDFSKIEAGYMKIEASDFNLGELVEEIAAMLYFKSEEKGVALECQIEELLRETNLLGDAIRIRQVLINLANNALKFTDKGKVRIHAGVLKQTTQSMVVKVTVKDTGMGIPDADKERVFAAFGQSRLTEGVQFGGTGLGLTISKTLIEKMGGSIGFESQEGIGSSFWFTLELPVSSGTPGVSTPRLAEIPSVLIADDNATNTQLIGSYLQRLGIPAFDIAANGKEAVGLASANHYRLILMDIQMPVMDGMEATRRIRNIEMERPLVPPARILAITAYSPASDLQKFISNGMDGMLRKPFLFDELRHALEQLLGDKFFSKNP